MLILYVQEKCPFSLKVIKAGEQMGMTFELRDIKDHKLEKELLAKGGKRETPYFIDTNTNVAMYGSDDIVSYLVNTLA